MPDQLAIQPSTPLVASIRPPGSKSITNRALLCAAMAAGQSTLHGVLDSEDTCVMMDCLDRLGVELHHDRTLDRVRITGCSGRLPCQEAELFVINSGTTIRFLTAMLAACEGQFRLDGNTRMRQRPMGDLLVALAQLGGTVESEQANSCPPLRIRANGLSGGTVPIRGDVSSQFLSGLLMACPLSSELVELTVDGPLVSQPYVRITLGVMNSFGVQVENQDFSRFKVPSRQQYQSLDYTIEPDASAASYFWGAAAITGGEVTVLGLSQKALQGDVGFVDCLQRMGCSVTYESESITVRSAGSLRGIDVDMNSISDTVQTLAAVALFAEGPTTITGVAHIRHKETDRIGDLTRELRKCGAKVEELGDGLEIRPPAQLCATRIETYDDHRMAMSFAVAGLRQPGMVILDSECVGKTYPEFFEDLSRVSK